MTSATMDSLFDVPEQCSDCGRTSEGSCYWCSQSRTALAAAEFAALASLNAAADLWRREAKWEITQYRATRAPFTAAEVTGKLRTRGIETKDGRAMGSIIRSLSKSGLIECVGIVPSPLSEHHHGISRQWKWTA